MKVKLVSVVALFVLLLGACSVPKDVVYFQGVDALTPEQVSKMNQAYTSKICPDDLLTITVTAWDPTVVTPFNPPVYAYATQGETRPGAISVKNDRLSILDAIGQVGDLTINANRKNILVIRDNNGEKEFARLDITEPDIFTSPYYYLQQNDVVYVEPNNAKKRNARYSQAQQYSITVFSSILSAVSVITTVILAITK